MNISTAKTLQSFAIALHRPQGRYKPDIRKITQNYAAIEEVTLSVD